jgi:hypothetical protein
MHNEDEQVPPPEGIYWITATREGVERALDLVRDKTNAETASRIFSGKVIDYHALVRAEGGESHLTLMFRMQQGFDFSQYAIEVDGNTVAMVPKKFSSVAERHLNREVRFGYGAEHSGQSSVINIVQIIIEP